MKTVMFVFGSKGGLSAWIATDQLTDLQLGVDARTIELYLKTIGEVSVLIEEQRIFLGHQDMVAVLEQDELLDVRSFNVDGHASNLQSLHTLAGGAICFIPEAYEALLQEFVPDNCTVKITRWEGRKFLGIRKG